MTIYLDVVLLENICMNYIILYATAVIYKINPNILRIILSSTIGAIYAILSYMQILEIYSNLFLKIVLSICMVYLAYKPKNIKTLSKQLLLFYLTSFIFGGISFALLYFIKAQDILMKNGIYIGTYPIKIVLLGAIVGFAIIKFTFKVIKGKITRKELLCQVEIQIGENKTKVIAMVDTGNMLKEPITKAPVIIVEKYSLKELLPEKILENITEILKGEKIETFEDYLPKFRVIPFSSIGKENGMLLGIKAENIAICTEEEKIIIPNVIVGICSQRLTKNGLYTALIGLDILERRENSEFTRFAQKQF